MSPSAASRTTVGSTFQQSAEEAVYVKQPNGDWTNKGYTYAPIGGPDPIDGILTYPNFPTISKEDWAKLLKDGSLPTDYPATKSMLDDMQPGGKITVHGVVWTKQALGNEWVSDDGEVLLTEELAKMIGEVEVPF